MFKLGIISQQQQAYIFTVKTDNAGTSSSDQFTLPLVSGGTYDFYIDWGDGVIDHITAYNQAEVTHTFAGGAGTYTVKIWGVIKGWKFNNVGDPLKYLTTEQVGILNLGNQIGVFFGAENHVWNATDLKYMAGVTTLNQCWRNNSAITTIPGLGRLLNSNITNLEGAFISDDNFNEPSISYANTSNVTTFLNIFNGCEKFNQDISNFNFEAINTTNGLTNFMVLNIAFSTANYDALLISMASQNILAGQTPHFGIAKWSFGFAGQARFDLLSVTGFASITDGGHADSTMGAWYNPHNVLKSIANPADGTGITTWSDLSNNANDATEATNPPLFKTNIANGEPMLLFNGSNSRLDIASDASLNGLFDGGGFFICAVIPLSQGQNSNGRIFSQGGGNTHLSLFSETAGTCKLRFEKNFDTTAGVWITDNLDININEVNIIAIEYDSSNAANDPVFYINSTTPVAITESTTPVGTSSTPSGMQIGNALFSNRTFDGYIGDLGFFKSVPSSAVREERMQYLATKLGVTLS